MSLYDSAKSQIKSVTNTIKTVANATINSTTITYGFIGVTTAIISYYTFFENDIEVPSSSPITNSPIMNSPIMNSPITSSPLLEQPSSPLLEQPSSPLLEQPSSPIFGQQQQGGRRKKTRRQKQ